jgi:hypothetical protein
MEMILQDIKPCEEKSKDQIKQNQKLLQERNEFQSLHRPFNRVHQPKNQQKLKAAKQKLLELA